MKDIFVSFSIFLMCVAIAVTSQLLSPSTINATTISTDSKKIQNTANITNPFEIDPNESNPTLFIMATNQPKETQKEVEKFITTSSGLKIADIEIGKGPEASSGQDISVNYRGSLESGKEFDSSYGRAPFNFPLGGGKVIKGWDEGVVGMKVGGKRKLIIPPNLGYGKRGIGPIPPNSTLIFEVELLEIN